MTKNKFQNLIKLAEEYYQQLTQLSKIAYIRKLPNGKYRVFSEKGKNMGTYPSKEQAKKRLQQIEYFKHKKASNNSILDLSDIEDLGYSSIMRKLNKNGNDDMTNCFLTIYKDCFDNSILKGENEDHILPKALLLFSKKYDINFPKK